MPASALGDAEATPLVLGQEALPWARPSDNH